MSFPLKTYLINLDKDVSRLKYVNNECKNNGIVPVRVPGILGSALSDEELEKYTTHFCKLFCTKSVIGCALSHMKCWSLIVENDDPEAMIIEDDVQFVPNFLQLFAEKYQDLPSSYDICFVGHCGPTKLIDNLLDINVKITDNIYIPKNPACMHCYLVSNKGAKLLLQNLNKIFGHVDLEIIMSLEKFETYAFNPDLAYQKTEYRTDTNNANIGFPHIINEYLSNIIDSEGRPIDYQLSATLYQINGYPINAWTFLFLLFGLILGLLFIKSITSFYILSMIFIVFMSIEYNTDKKYYKDIIGSIIMTIFGILLSFCALKFIKNVN